MAQRVAVDGSSSMAPAEQALHRSGFIEEFRSPAVHKAIARGALGRVAVAYVERSGAEQSSNRIATTSLGSSSGGVPALDFLKPYPRGRGSVPPSCRTIVQRTFVQRWCRSTKARSSQEVRLCPFGEQYCEQTIEP